MLLGHAHPDLLLASLTRQQWFDWLAYLREEPRGDRRADLHHARLMAGMFNLMRDPKAKSAPYEVRDFMPFRKPEPVRPQRVDVLDTMRGWFGRRLRKPKAEKGDR